MFLHENYENVPLRGTHDTTRIANAIPRILNPRLLSRTYVDRDVSLRLSICRLGEDWRMGLLTALALFLRAWLVSRLHLAAENLALRQQLAVLQQSNKRPKLRPRDRVIWTWLMRLWPNWRSALIIVKPETVIKWHRGGSFA